MLDKSKINVGDTHSEVVVEDLKRTQIVQYAGASGDYNPLHSCLLYTSPSPRDRSLSRMPSSA